MNEISKQRAKLKELIEAVWNKVSLEEGENFHGLPSVVTSIINNYMTNYYKSKECDFIRYKKTSMLAGLYLLYLADNMNTKSTKPLKQFDFKAELKRIDILLGDYKQQAYDAIKKYDPNIPVEFTTDIKRLLLREFARDAKDMTDSEIRVGLGMDPAPAI